MDIVVCSATTKKPNSIGNLMQQHMRISCNSMRFTHAVKFFGLYIMQKRERNEIVLVTALPAAHCAMTTQTLPQCVAQ